MTIGATIAEFIFFEPRVSIKRRDNTMNTPTEN
jgi:hypothetical protein